MEPHPAEGGELAGKFSMFRQGRAHPSPPRALGRQGLPGRAGGAGIPLGARVISVADCYDAMTSDRPYREALPAAVAIDELHRCTGTQFDRDVVAAFTAMTEADLSTVMSSTRARPRNSARSSEHASWARSSATSSAAGCAISSSSTCASPGWCSPHSASRSGPSRRWGASAGVSVVVPLHYASYALLVLFVLANHRRPAVVVLGVGMALNLLVIALNDGYMPARRAALESAGQIYAGSAEHNSALITASTKLALLGDVFAVPSWVPLANVFSIGDVLIVVGATALIAATMRRSRELTAQAA